MSNLSCSEIACNTLVKSVIDSGLPVETILILLTFPILAALIGIVRHLIGLSTMGFYISIFFGFCFYFLGSENYEGLIFGVPITVGIMLLAIFLRNLTKQFRVHYLPRMSLITSIISVIVLITISLLAVLSKGNITLYQIFPIITIIILAERFLSLLIRKNEQVITMNLAESILFGVIAYFVLIWRDLKVLLLAHPEILLAVIIVNFLVASTSQLRLTEFLRFNQVFSQYEREKRVEEPKNN